MFAEKESVTYRGMCGVICFVCASYVVIEMPPIEGRNPPKLLVYPHNYKDIISQKQSTK
jgi:hypothetical protein